MCSTIEFSIPGKPQAKQRHRTGKNGAHYTPKETRAYQRLCAAMASLSMAGLDWDDSARYSVSLWIYFPDKRRRDLDNIEKSVFDGLNGTVWRDDSQVDHVEKWRMLDRDNPRVELTVRVMDADT